MSVDATDYDHRVLHATEEIPVTPGTVTLYYPEWLPGTHSVAWSSVKSLSGLQFIADGKPLAWTRDLIDMGEFHVQVPEGVSQITAKMVFLTPAKSQGDQNRVTMSQDMVAVNWSSVILYPAGTPVADIAIRASVKLPATWQFGTSLDVDRIDGQKTTFKLIDLDTLVDSPVLAGRYFKKVELTQAPVRVSLDVAADRPEDLVATTAQIEAHRALVTQAMNLYQSHHYDHYDFLLSLSNTVGIQGLEHEQSSENGVGEDYFTDWDNGWVYRDLLPHEYTHSWNGKFKRPEDLATTNFNVPMRDSLLWVYEGQTQFWGKVLAARSGLVSQEQTREVLAQLASRYGESRPGRMWRNLQDTTSFEIITNNSPSGWGSWTRTADYYDEMVLVWLDADSRIREASHDTRSMDDFAHAFFGVEDGTHKVHTYTFESVVDVLNQVQAEDWKTFLRTRLDQHESGDLMAGLERSGWKLVYTDEPNQAQKAEDKLFNQTNYETSIGLTMGKEGQVDDVLWNGPAFKAGLAPGLKLLAVNDIAYADNPRDPLKDALDGAKSSDAPIELLVRDGDIVRRVKVDYHDGLHQPHLVRVVGQPDYLTELLSPR